MPALPSFGRYTTLGVLGQGGMGTVYLARHPDLDYEVAIKTLLAGGEASSEERSRFEREIRALSELHHPGLAVILEAGEERGLPWFAMRRIEGQDLEERLRTEGPLSPAQVISLGLELCDAVGAAHALGILHRDLKPDNVVCTPEGHYVVTDLGLSKDLSREESIRLSRTGALLGTPGYWAPEQASGRAKEASERTDVYGVGAVLYAALTGLPPITGESMLEVLIATRETAPARPSTLTSVPPWLEAAIMRCLEKAPDQRWSSLGELGEALRRADSTPASSGLAKVLIPALCLGLTLSLLGLWALGAFSHASPPQPARSSPEPSGTQAPQSGKAWQEIARAIAQEDPQAVARWAPRLAPGEVQAARLLALERLDAHLEPLSHSFVLKRLKQRPREPLTEETRWPWTRITTLVGALEHLPPARVPPLQEGEVLERLLERLMQAGHCADGVSDLRNVSTLMNALGASGLRASRRLRPFDTTPFLTSDLVRVPSFPAEMRLAFLQLDIPLDLSDYTDTSRFHRVTLPPAKRPRDLASKPLQELCDLRSRALATRSKQAHERLKRILQDPPEALGPFCEADALSYLAAQYEFSLAERTKWAERALELDSSSPWVQISLGLCLAERGEWDRARDYAKAARALHDQEQRKPAWWPGESSLTLNAFFSARACVLFAALGDTERSRLHLKAVLRDSPELARRTAARAEEVRYSAPR